MKTREEQLFGKLREATAALRTALDERDALRKERTEPIAIVGMGCRFPGGASDPSAYFQLLCDGKDAVVELATRWEHLGVKADEKLPRWAALLTEPIDMFDSAFFGIAPREAHSLDPQQRLFLEVAWEALEDAGIKPHSLNKSRTGVFVGACTDDYSSLVERQAETEKDAYSTIGNMRSVLGGRLSYSLGLQGPCITVDTACSSSLVAIYLACRSLRNRESNLALAGGVSLHLSLDSTVGLSRIQALSPDGRCRTFDAMANGYVRGEGCGVLVLKRLCDAERDGDRVWAVIRGLAINQDGRSTGLTAPNVIAQQELIADALADAGVTAESIGYVETHGTATALGDPIEVEALRAVLGAPRASGAACVLGAVKTNIGHLEGAAGVAGVIKTALVLAKQRIPKNLNFRTLNAHIDLAGSCLRVATELAEWPRGSTPRYAGVSGFGLSGTNVHLVLAEAPDRPVVSASTPQKAQLVIVSGRSEAALRAQAASLRKHVLAHPETNLADLSYSLSRTRSELEHRAALVCGSHKELLDGLAALEVGASFPQLQVGRVVGNAATDVVFVFPGQGSQWIGMGQTLLREEPLFETALRACDRAIQAEAGFSVIEALTAEDAAAKLEQIEIVQPTLFALSVALAAVWRGYGIEPSFVVGHSMGEVAAAYVASALSLADAVAVICRRSRLLRRISGQGEMAMIELSAAEAERAIAPLSQRVSVAVCNSPRSTVIAGDRAAIAEIVDRLSAQGIFVRRVKVDVASHSPQVDPLRSDILTALRDVTPQALAIPMYSTVSGERLGGKELDAAYWERNLRQPVRFSEVIERLLVEGHGLLLEVSPHPLLIPAMEEMRLGSKREGRAIGSLRRGQGDRTELLCRLGELWIAGAHVNWNKVEAIGRQRIDLPTYAWQRQHCWVTAAKEGDSPFAQSGRVDQIGKRSTSSAGISRQGTESASAHPILGELMRLNTQPNIRLWNTALSSAHPAWISDHRVNGALVFPGTGHLEMLCTAGIALFGSASFSLTYLALLDALIVPEQGSIAVQVEANLESETVAEVQIISRQIVQGKHLFHVHSRARLEAERKPEQPGLHITTLVERMPQTQSIDSFYANMLAMGLQLGPAFRGLCALWKGEGEALGRLLLPTEAGTDSGYQFHPALLDACLQVMAGCFGTEGETTPWIPVKIEGVRWFRRPSGELYCHAKTLLSEDPSADRRCASLCISDSDGVAVVCIEKLTVQRIESARRAAHDSWYLGVDWEEKPVGKAQSGARKWLLLGDGGSLAHRLHDALVSAGHEVCLRKESRPDLEMVHKLLRSAFSGQAPDAIVCLFGMDAAIDGNDPVQGVSALCLSLLAAVQAVAGAGFREVPRIWVLTRGGQAVGAETAEPGAASLWGLGRTVALEHPDLRCARVDLDVLKGTDEAAEVLAELLADEEEEEIAYRHGHRYVSRLDRQNTPSSLRSRKRPGLTIRKDRSYLLSGGLGGLGQSVARWLAKQGAGRIVLLSRHGVQTTAQAECVSALREDGADVWVVSADVAERTQVAQTLARIASEGLPLAGVVHAAGVLDDGLLMQQTAARFDQVLRPKVAGAWNLSELTRDLPLDFFVLYSSAAGLLGSPGQGNYAAANAYLDALAHKRCSEGLTALGINWGPFAEVGLAAAQSNRAERLALRGMRSLRPAEGVTILAELLGRSEGQIGVVPLDVRQWGAFHQSALSSPRFARLKQQSDADAPSAGDGELRLRIMQTPFAQRPLLLADCLRGHVSHVLRIPEAELDLDAPLTSLGLDSLMGLELRNRLESALGARVKATILWTYPTVRSLSEHLAKTLFPDDDAMPKEPHSEVPAVQNPSDEVAQLDDQQLLALIDDELALARKHGA